MSTLRLALAVGDYDVTRALLDGTVRPQGVDPVMLTCPSPQRHWRMLRDREFDVAELSLASYVAQRSRGDGDLIAIPVFPHRRFRHGYVFVSGAAGPRHESRAGQRAGAGPDAGPRSASDLAGQRVGLRTWQTTAGVWLRGILAEHHGLPLDTVQWLTQDPEDVPLDLPAGVALERAPAGENVVEMCGRGQIAGLIYPELPRPVLAGDPSIRRLFGCPKETEQAYFRATGIFPIMHVVAARANLLERHPWLARNLVTAFEEAKRLAFRRLEDPRTVSLAWLRALQEEERDILGPDPWRYGMNETNRHVLATFLQYAEQQGVAATRMSPEDLFHPATLQEPPAYV